MNCEFRTQDVGNGYSIVEPPAGLLQYIHKKLKLYTDDPDTGLTQSIWASIFVLACLHRHGKPVVVGVIQDNLTNTLTDVESFTTIRKVYTNLNDEAFKSTVEEFMFNIPYPQLKEWFEKIEEDCYITQKKQDEVKND
jgi:hypothetical protein